MHDHEAMTTGTAFGESFTEEIILDERVLDQSRTNQTYSSP
jgi:hypothetical protein